MCGCIIGLSFRRAVERQDQLFYLDIYLLQTDFFQFIDDSRRVGLNQYFQKLGEIYFWGNDENVRSSDMKQVQ